MSSANFTTIAPLAISLNCNSTNYTRQRLVVILFLHHQEILSSNTSSGAIIKADHMFRGQSFAPPAQQYGLHGWNGQPLFSLGVERENTQIKNRTCWWLTTDPLALTKIYPLSSSQPSIIVYPWLLSVYTKFGGVQKHLFEITIKHAEDTTCHHHQISRRNLFPKHFKCWKFQRDIFGTRESSE